MCQQFTVHTQWEYCMDFHGKAVEIVVLLSVWNTLNLYAQDQWLKHETYANRVTCDYIIPNTSHCSSFYHLEKRQKQKKNAKNPKKLKCPPVQRFGNKSEKSEHEMTSLLAMSATPRLSSVCPENLLPRAKQCAGSWLQASLNSNNTLKHIIPRGMHLVAML